MKKELFQHLIVILEAEGFRYALVGNTERYPDEIGSGVDIMVHEDDLDTFRAAIWKIEDSTTKIIKLLQHEIVAFYYVVARVTDLGVTIIQPDVCSNYFRKGVKLLSSSEMLVDVSDACDNDGESKGFKVLSPSKEFIYYCVKKIDKGCLDEGQFAHLKKCHMADPSGCQDWMLRFWRTEEVEKISEFMSRGDYSAFLSQLPVLKKALRHRVGLGWTYTLANFALKVKRCLQPTGYVLCVCGDGSGKGEVIKQLSHDFGLICRRQKVVPISKLSVVSALMQLIKDILPRIKSTLIIYSIPTASPRVIRLLFPDAVLHVGKSLGYGSEKHGAVLDLFGFTESETSRVTINKFLLNVFSSRISQRHRPQTGSRA